MVKSYMHSFKTMTLGRSVKQEYQIFQTIVTNPATAIEWAAEALKMQTGPLAVCRSAARVSLQR